MRQEVRSALMELGLSVVEELAVRVAQEADTLAPQIQPEDAPGFAGSLRRGPDKRGSGSSGPIKGNIGAQESKRVPFSWLVVSYAWYSHFVEYGTDPHTMPRKSRSGKVMVFPGTNGNIGDVVGTDFVNHPGIKRPFPFLRPAADKAEMFAREIIAAHGLNIR